MTTIASRTLAAKPGALWEALDREGAVVITKDGVPRSIMIPTSDVTLLEDVQEIVFARAREAVRAIRARATRRGATWLTRRSGCSTRTFWCRACSRHSDRPGD